MSSLLAHVHICGQIYRYPQIQLGSERKVFFSFPKHRLTMYSCKTILTAIVKQHINAARSE